MSVRRYLIGSAVGASVIIPILIGASCPPPTTPGLYGLVTDTVNTTVLPPCNSGFICVTFTNSTIIPVKVALYRNNGFNQRDNCGARWQFSCCTNPNSTVACLCPCTGADVGECKLNFVQLFEGCYGDSPSVNVEPIEGANSTKLDPSQSLQKRLRCAEAKTLGATVARNPDDPVAAPLDQNGPVYRDEAGGVACGGTVQFLVVDLNQTTAGDTTSQDLVTLAIRAQFSQ